MKPMVVDDDCCPFMMNHAHWQYYCTRTADNMMTMIAVRIVIGDRLLLEYLVSLDGMLCQAVPCRAMAQRIARMPKLSGGTWE